MLCFRQVHLGDINRTCQVSNRAAEFTHTVISTGGQSQLAQELLEVVVPVDWLASLQPAGFEGRYLTFNRQQVLSDQYCTVSPLLQSPSTAKLWGLKWLGGKLVVIRENSSSRVRG